VLFQNFNEEFRNAKHGIVESYRDIYERIVLLDPDIVIVERAGTSFDAVSVEVLGVVKLAVEMCSDASIIIQNPSAKNCWEVINKRYPGFETELRREYEEKHAIDAVAHLFYALYKEYSRRK